MLNGEEAEKIGARKGTVRAPEAGEDATGQLPVGEGMNLRDRR